MTTITYLDDSGEDSPMTTQTFLVSTGHAEYGVYESIPGLDVADLWPPAAMNDDDRDRLYDLWENEQVVTWLRYYPDEGLPPDADLAWEHIVRWTGDTPAINAGLDVLIQQISVEPHGDDDTFDYWPSGCRYALDVAGYVGRAQEVEQVIRGVIASKDLGEYADELFDKVGMDSGEVESDEWSDHRYNDAPFCAKCSGPCRSQDGRPDSGEG